jgi:hypothetical protein
MANGQTPTRNSVSEAAAMSMLSSPGKTNETAAGSFADAALSSIGSPAKSAPNAATDTATRTLVAAESIVNKNLASAMAVYNTTTTTGGGTNTTNNNPPHANQNPPHANQNAMVKAPDGTPLTLTIHGTSCHSSTGNTPPSGQTQTQKQGSVSASASPAKIAPTPCQTQTQNTTASTPAGAKNATTPTNIAKPSSTHASNAAQTQAQTAQSPSKDVKSTLHSVPAVPKTTTNDDKMTDASAVQKSASGHVDVIVKSEPESSSGVSVAATKVPGTF